MQTVINTWYCASNQWVRIETSSPAYAVGSLNGKSTCFRRAGDWQLRALSICTETENFLDFFPQLVCITTTKILLLALSRACLRFIFSVCSFIYLFSRYWHWGVFFFSRRSFPGYLVIRKLCWYGLNFFFASNNHQSKHLPHLVCNYRTAR